MNNLKIYKIKKDYIDYMSQFAPHFFQNKKTSQHNERKYIGIVLEVNKHKYFAPLSSFKEKHKYMKDKIDFIKIKDYAVINLNNMFPAPDFEIIDFDISKVSNLKYKLLYKGNIVL